MELINCSDTKLESLKAHIFSEDSDARVASLVVTWYLQEDLQVRQEVAAIDVFLATIRSLLVFKRVIDKQELRLAQIKELGISSDLYQQLAELSYQDFRDRSLKEKINIFLDIIESSYRDPQRTKDSLVDNFDN